MIRRLRLENWKAYENLDLSFGAGATFVVAQNGVGKSSLMQGLIYGLYGETALGFPAEKARRAGAQSSTVEVTVELPGGVTLVVARHLAAPKKSGSRVRHKVEATVNGEPITGDQMTTELSARLGAAVDQLPSLTVLKEGDVLREGDSGPSFNVVAHLSSLLGVDRATSTASQLDRLESQQSRAGDAFRRERVTHRDRAPLGEIDVGSVVAVVVRKARHVDGIGPGVHRRDDAPEKSCRFRIERRLAGREIDDEVCPGQLRRWRTFG